MTLAPGARLGPYEIVAALGAGGMGEVFRARDTKLGRDVALKLLPDAAALDPERLARFEREARTLAALNHPAIVTIYAVEEAAGTHFIAMACVEGRTLADVMPKGGLPLDRLLAIAVPLADAVGTAHQHDIVHRDLKPANVMIGSHDRVTVLDFGLAKLCETAPATEATMLPARDLTGEGRIVGTVAYMSPEQAEGKHVDERSDVFSLGVLLYEMATGARPFTGDTSLSVLSAILKDSPKPLTDLNPMLPRDLSRIVRRCLAKDPDRRYQSAMDLRNDLEDLQQSALSGELHAVSSVRPAPPARFWPAAMAVVITGALLAVGWLLMRTPAAVSGPAAPVMAYSRLTLQEGVALDPSISPDGKWVVYVGGASGNQDIYLQSVSGQTAINLTQDSSAADTAPVFSPDGESIAFQSTREGGGLYVMGRTGESVRRLTQRGFQPAWFPDGRQIVFATQDAPTAEGRAGGVSELWIVNATGGEPRRLFAGDAVQPRVSPNGRRIAFWSLPTDAEHKRFAGANRDIWTIAADGTSPVLVTPDEAIDWNPVWSPDGRWLYFLSNRSGGMNLWRIAIDEASGATSGQPQPLTVPASYIRHFTLSADGRTGTYATWAVSNNLARARFDPRDAAVQGPVEPITTGPRDFASPDVSPDGQSLAIATSNRQQEDVYVIAANGGGLRNVTNDRFRDRYLRWAADGRRILFYSDRGGNFELWSIDRDGSGLGQLTKTSGRYYPVPSRDGSTVAAAELSTWELYLYDARDFSKPPESLPQFPAELRSGGLVLSDWSPDGRLLTGAAAGAVWVYSRDTRAYRRVTDGAGPSWLPDGRRLLFNQQGRVFVTDWLSGEPRQVLAIPGEAVGAPRLNADGSLLYFLHGTASGDIWVVRFDETATDASKD